jgi:hypothetical protein
LPQGEIVVLIVVAVFVYRLRSPDVGESLRGHPPADIPIPCPFSASPQHPGDDDEVAAEYLEMLFILLARFFYPYLTPSVGVETPEVSTIVFYSALRDSLSPAIHPAPSTTTPRRQVNCFWLCEEILRRRHKPL